jgi:hypothetical protein
MCFLRFSFDHLLIFPQRDRRMEREGLREGEKRVFGGIGGGTGK